MTAAEFLQWCADVLDDAGIEYMVVGSMASSYHGSPRSTRDLDIVIEIAPEQAEMLLGLLDRQRFYVDDAEVRSAPTQRRMFGIIDTVSGWKVDLVVRRDRPFAVSEFARRQKVVLLGVDTWAATAEDVILAKLEWSQLGSSDRQLEDAQSVIRVRRSQLDWDYLERWAAELRVTDLLRAASDD
jgi:hypothetical protein